MAKRKWEIFRNEYATDEEYAVAVQNELASFWYIGHRMGFAVIAAPIRERQHGDRFIETGWGFRTDTVPAIPAPQAQVIEFPVEPQEQPAEAPAEGASY